MAIYIRANGVEDLGNGIYGIVLPTQELSRESRETLASLFPNTMDKVYELLQMEMLMDSLATPEEIVKIGDGQGTPVRKRKATKPVAEMTKLQEIFIDYDCTQFWDRKYESMDTQAVRDDLLSRLRRLSDEDEASRLNYVIDHLADNLKKGK